MSLDFDKLRNQLKTNEERMSGGAEFRSVKFWKLKKSSAKIRVVPAWTSEGDNAGQFWYEVAQHWNVSEDQSFPILCTEKTPGAESDGPCLVCEFIRELRKQKTNTAAQDLAKDIRPQIKFFMNIIDLSDPEYTAEDVAEYKAERPDDDPPFEVGDLKIQIYPAPTTVYNQITQIILQNEVDITDPKKGHDVTISRTGKGRNVKYGTTIVLKPRSYELEDTSKIPALDKVATPVETEKVMEFLSSGVGSAGIVSLDKALSSGTPEPSAAPETVVGDPETRSADNLGDNLEAELKALAAKGD